MRYETIRDDITEKKDGFYVNVHGDEDADVDTYGPMDETIFVLFCKALHRMELNCVDEDSIEWRICEDDDDFSYDDLKSEYESDPQKFLDEIPEEDLKQYLDPDIFERIRDIGYYHPRYVHTDCLTDIDSFDAICVKNGTKYKVELLF